MEEGVGGGTYFQAATDVMPVAGTMSMDLPPKAPPIEWNTELKASLGSYRTLKLNINFFMKNNC